MREYNRIRFPTEGSTTKELDIGLERKDKTRFK